MYNYFKGTITNIDAKSITLECNNIGYLFYTPSPFSFTLGEEITIYCYLHVREDIFDLYGFKTSKERDFFFKLISVKGLGPKGALAILASGNSNDIINAINSGDSKYLQRFPGVGPKASQQIVLDLHGKLNLDEVTTSKTQDPKITQAVEALKNLGYKQSELKKIIPTLEDNLSLSINELIKLALKNLY